MSAVTTQGFGDAATWPTCAGHPHDPRTPEMSEACANAHEVCAEIRLWLEMAECGLIRGDLSQFAAAMECARSYMVSMDFSGVNS